MAKGLGLLDINLTKVAGKFEWMLKNIGVGGRNQMAIPKFAITS